MSTAYPPAPQPAPKKKISPIVWILGGCGVFVVLAILVVIAGGLFVFNKAKQAGLDPELMRKNPALGAAVLAFKACKYARAARPPRLCPTKTIVAGFLSCAIRFTAAPTCIPNCTYVNPSPLSQSPPPGNNASLELNSSA